METARYTREGDFYFITTAALKTGANVYKADKGWRADGIAVGTTKRFTGFGSTRALATDALIRGARKYLAEVNAANEGMEFTTADIQKARNIIAAARRTAAEMVRVAAIVEDRAAALLNLDTSGHDLDDLSLSSLHAQTIYQQADYMRTFDIALDPKALNEADLILTCAARERTPSTPLFPNS